MTDLDISSYSCDELVNYLDIHGTDREKQLLDAVSQINIEKDSIEEELEQLQSYTEDVEGESIGKDHKIEELEEIIEDLKDRVKELEN